MKRFAATTLALAAFGSISMLWLRGYRLEPEHGALLTTVDGVDIHYHRYDSDERSPYGEKWQCVELVNRWLVAHGHWNLQRTGHALSYFTEARTKGLVSYSNGGTEKPERGDIIVFESSVPEGHVGIVIEADESSVLVAQQNMTLTLWPLPFAKPLPLERFVLSHNDGKWTVAPRRSLTCLGWARRK